LPDVIERTGVVAGLATHWREAPASGRPVLYVHGVPTASWDWNPYLERIGGVAPDLPGFGTSAKPADFDYSVAGHVRWLEAFTEAVGLERFSLVVHDWGGVVGLALAQRMPERIERLVIHSHAPCLPSEDPYIGPEWGQRYADVLGGEVRVEMIDRAGHWTWLDRPDVIEQAADFLDAAT
jgi:pimeloyl-ACP methyl ester carboxylesterase